MTNDSKVSNEEISTARSVLLWLSENSADGRLRDSIRDVRHELFEELYRRDGEAATARGVEWTVQS